MLLVAPVLIHFAEKKVVFVLMFESSKHLRRLSRDMIVGHGSKPPLYTVNIDAITENIAVLSEGTNNTVVGVLYEPIGSREAQTERHREVQLSDIGQVNNHWGWYVRLSENYSYY